MPAIMTQFQCKDILNRLDHTMGHIRGKIVDINGKAIEGSKILIRESGHRTFSDKQGNFIAINIPPALYTICVEHEGYAPSVTPDLPVFLGDNPGHLFSLYASDIPEKTHGTKFSDEFALQL
jgi:hypothetical protein